jgi:hypothetical protein
MDGAPKYRCSRCEDLGFVMIQTRRHHPASMTMTPRHPQLTRRQKPHTAAAPCPECRYGHAAYRGQMADIDELMSANPPNEVITK